MPESIPRPLPSYERWVIYRDCEMYLRWANREEAVDFIRDLRTKFPQSEFAFYHEVYTEEIVS